MKGLKVQCMPCRKMRCRPDSKAWEGVELAKIYDNVQREKKRADKAMYDNEMYRQKCILMEEELRQYKLEKEKNREDNEKLREELDKTRIELRDTESRLQKVSEEVSKIFEIIRMKPLNK